MRISILLSACLCLGMFGAGADAATILFDLQGTATESATQDGWTALEAPNTNASTFTASATSAPVTATIAATGGGFLAGRSSNGQDRGGDLSNLTHEDVHGDLIAARGGNGGMLLTLDGLIVGVETTVTAFHNDANGGNSGFAVVGNPVLPTIVSGADLVSATTGAHTNLSRPGVATSSGPYEDSDLVPSVIVFTPTSSTTQLLFSSDNSSDFLPVSGITVAIVPEPSTIALLGLAGIGLVAARRRK